MSHLARMLLSLAVLVLFAASLPSGSRAQDLDLDTIFRCNGETAIEVETCVQERNVILTNCTVCHMFVPIVLQQFDEDGWRGLLDRHVGNGRVDQLTKEQVDELHAYLAATFNESLPPPDLPASLLETWTSY